MRPLHATRCSSCPLTQHEPQETLTLNRARVGVPAAGRRQLLLASSTSSSNHVTGNTCCTVASIREQRTQHIHKVKPTAKQSVPGRREVLLAAPLSFNAACLSAAAAPPSSEPQQQQQQQQPSAAAPAPAAVATQLYRDPRGAFQVLVPVGWQQVNLLPGTSILGSWYDADNRGSDILTVYASPTTAATTADLGTPQEVGEALAAISPVGTLQQWGTDTRGGRQYITTQVMFSGPAAYLFKEVLDVRCSVVVKGYQYTLRASSKAANLRNNPEWCSTLNNIVASFEVTI